MLFYPASGDLSIAVNTTCDDAPLPRTVPVCGSPVILKCCIQRCDIYSEQWYRQIESKEEYIKDGLDLTVNFNSTQENYTCDILSFSPGCDSGSKGYVSLIKGIVHI